MEEAQKSNDEEEPQQYRSTWEPAVAQRIREGVEKSSEKKTTKQVPYMVALVGIPGSGKSVSSFLLANILDKEYDIATMIMPHDGYHYPVKDLQMFPDAQDAIYRRGAPDTFDPQALLRDLLRIRGDDGGRQDDEQQQQRITLPAFDHAKGDPEPDKHVFDRHKHKVVVCEGLYLLHDGDGWENVASVFDLKIFVNSNVDNCIERLKIRNQCIPGYTPEEIAVRCEQVDRVNAMTVMRSKARADVVVESLAT